VFAGGHSGHITPGRQLFSGWNITVQRQRRLQRRRLGGPLGPRDGHAAGLRSSTPDCAEGL